MDYLALINDNLYEFENEDGTTSDDWTLVTGWDRKFGKRWSLYLESTNTQEFITALEKEAGIPPIYSEGSGRGAKTYLHPLLTIHYAEWLSPQFSIAAKQVLHRYLKGDVTLADEIVERNIEQTGSTKDAQDYYNALHGGLN